MAQYLRQFQVLLAALAVLSLSGCGVTRLWGGEEALIQQEVRPGVSLREQAADLSKTAWVTEEKGSLMSQVAGVLVNGARSAGEALDVFDWTDSESAETRQAKRYIQQIGAEKDTSDILKAITSDIEAKNKAGAEFRTSGVSALDYYHKELQAAETLTDASARKDRIKFILNEADEDRRASIQASKSLRQQASIFAAAREVLAEKDKSLDVEGLASEVAQLRLRADELRALAEELDLD